MYSHFIGNFNSIPYRALHVREALPLVARSPKLFHNMGVDTLHGYLSKLNRLCHKPVHSFKFCHHASGQCPTSCLQQIVGIAPLMILFMLFYLATNSLIVPYFWKPFNIEFGIMYTFPPNRGEPTYSACQAFCISINMLALPCQRHSFLA